MTDPCRRRIKLLHLIPTLDMGGSEMMLYKLLSRMDPSRFSNVVVSMTTVGPLGAAISALGIDVRALGMRRGFPRPEAAWRFYRMLRSEKPDILQTWLYHADFLGLLTARLAGVPAVAWSIRCSDMDWSYYSSLSRFEIGILARFSRFPGAVIVNSEAGLRVHEAMGYRPRRWEVVPNGFDLERFRPDASQRERLRRSMGAAPDAVLIGLVARYDAMKDHMTFLEAARRMIRDRPDAHFALIGEGVDEKNQELVGRVRELGLARRVHLLGPRSDIAAVMPAFDLVTLSSISEGFPNVIGEAMACAVPCVATNVGDVSVVIGDTGRVVPPRDPDALSRGWRELLDLKPEARKALGAAARRRVEEKYGLTAAAARFEQIYETLVPPEVSLAAR